MAEAPSHIIHFNGERFLADRMSDEHVTEEPAETWLQRTALRAAADPQCSSRPQVVGRNVLATSSACSAPAAGKSRLGGLGQKGLQTRQNRRERSSSGERMEEPLR